MHTYDFAIISVNALSYWLVLYCVINHVEKAKKLFCKFIFADGAIPPYNVSLKRKNKPVFFWQFYY
jgi:hypothetical protein